MTAIVEAPVTAPGIRGDLSLEAYHADRSSLSSSGARKLLAPSCPALFKYEQDNPQPPKKTFDLGHAAHKLVLGEGPELVVVDRPKWDTIAVKAEVAEIRAVGNVPLKQHEYDQVQAMADAIRLHPTASHLFEPGSGLAEQSLFWTDPPTGIARRARPDWMPHRGDGRLVVVDYKTCTAADPDALAKAVYDHGYHQQAAWYLDGVKALGLHGDQEPAFIFVFQTKTAPYLVHLVELDFTALGLGAARNREALRIYAECTRTGHWPGFNDRITYLPLPAWAEKRDQEEYS